MVIGSVMKCLLAAFANAIIDKAACHPESEISPSAKLAIACGCICTAQSMVSNSGMDSSPATEAISTFVLSDDDPYDQ